MADLLAPQLNLNKLLSEIIMFTMYNIFNMKIYVTE